MRKIPLWPGRASPLSQAAVRAKGRVLACLQDWTQCKSLLLVGLFVLLSQGATTAAAASQPLILGVFPHLTAKQIIENYRPLVSALEKQLDRRVAVYSAPNLRKFVEHTQRGEYDILLTPPHLAWLARQDAGYRPLLKYTEPVHGLLVVRADSSFTSPDALRGRTIATADAIAVAGLAIEAQLAERGLRLGIDYRTMESGTHSSTVMQVINKRADAAMIGQHAYQLMAKDLRKQLRILAKTPPLSSLMYLTHPRLGDHDVKRVRQALLDFAVSPEGRAFMQRGQYGGVIDTDGNELHAFRPYAQQAQEILRTRQ